jgi:hypothetical protein
VADDPTLAGRKPRLKSDLCIGKEDHRCLIRL